MAILQLNKGFTTLIDDDIVDDVKPFRWYVVPRPRTNYVRRSIPCGGKTKYEYLHQRVLGVRPGFEIDHIDGNTLDNRRANLRHATRQQNMRNQAKRSRQASSQYKGVCWSNNDNRWLAYLLVNRKRFWLGRFTDEREAARAYNAAALHHFGDFARLNEI
jgi:hypothetical protein